MIRQCLKLRDSRAMTQNYPLIFLYQSCISRHALRGVGYARVLELLNFSTRRQLFKIKRTFFVNASLKFFAHLSATGLEILEAVFFEKESFQGDLLIANMNGFASFGSLGFPLRLLNLRIFYISIFSGQEGNDENNGDIGKTAKQGFFFKNRKVLGFQ